MFRFSKKTAFSIALPAIDPTVVKAAQPTTPETVTPMNTLTPIPAVLPILAAPARFLHPVALGTAEPVRASSIELHILAIENRELRAAAAVCANALGRLVTHAAMASLLSQAVETARDTNVTPEQWLADKLEAVEEEIELSKMECERLEARCKVRSARTTPLMVAVSWRLTAAETDIRRLQEIVRNAETHPFGGQAENKFQRLIDAGLSPDQIKLTGISDPVSKIAAEAERAKARIAVLQAELPALRAFSNDRAGNTAHLAGLQGFDTLIAAALNVVEEGAE